MRPQLNSGTLGGRMSYEISLYTRGFLKRAIENNLGDWTGADPISAHAVESLATLAAARGFQRTPPDPSFVEFLRSKGVAPAEEFLLDTSDLLAQLSFHDGQIAFSIPYSSRAGASIVLCSELARTIAREHDLAFYDPQEGIADY
ncbi:MAG TPA: hypothetical protein VHC20_08305 [Candidatus Paceibacterota bacterium]|nr:hypothetical protein [Candidatus Paceibacterota bacterium]